MNNYKVNQHVLAVLVTTLLAMPVMAEPISDEAAIQLLQRLNEMEREVSSLRGENEQLRNDLEELQKNQKDGFLQVDERIEKLNPDQPAEGVPVSDDATTDSKDTAADAKTEGKPEKGDPNGFYSYGTGTLDDKNLAVSKSDEKTAEDSSKPTDVPATDDTKPAESSNTDSQPLPAREERSVYDEAFKTLLKDPKAAIPAFRSFLKDYPESSLAPSAQYWVGEALYAEKDYKAATDEFLVVLKDYKGSDKAPDAALKLGYSFYEMKEWVKARKTLEDVTKFFPDSDASKLAGERLDKMKGEGH
ncbi:MAG: tol-pal system protein YbgF [Gammaproteobacteria bacterium]|nr:tol-pal system protein YbgF [Gammaproteobacteria bacterium]MBU1724345.1 tol-pal system protein YbgF [Gammaproteobacteria bacterium]MBU2005983.1 tol-pal system protein YbgF [Gammaproteobacteria bacterium]